MHDTLKASHDTRFVFRFKACHALATEPHLSKNRQPRVLARIQPQLIFIPSYSSRTPVGLVCHRNPPTHLTRLTHSDTSGLNLFEPNKQYSGSK